MTLFQTKMIIVENFWYPSIQLKVNNIDYHEDCLFQTESSILVLMFCCGSVECRLDMIQNGWNGLLLAETLRQFPML